jgi:hypothetical protein
MSRIAVKNPNVFIALNSFIDNQNDGGRRPGRNFPSFTLTLGESHNARFKTIEQYQERVIREYRAVGINNVTVNRGFSATYPGIRGTAPTIQLSFTRSGELMRAIVSFVEHYNRELILTFIDTAAAFENDPETRRILFGSFRNLSQIKRAPSFRERRVNEVSELEDDLEPRASYRFSDEIYGSSDEYRRATFSDSTAADWFLGNDAKTNGLGIMGILVAIASFVGLRRSRPS